MTQEDLQKVAMLYTEWDAIEAGRLSGDESSLTAAKIALTISDT